MNNDLNNNLKNDKFLFVAFMLIFLGFIYAAAIAGADSLLKILVANLPQVEEGNKIKVIDLIQIDNARRSFAISMGINQGNQTDKIDILALANKDYTGIIKEIAGNSTVFVKQAIVYAGNNEINDITPQILKKLGLPEPDKTVDINRLTKSLIDTSSGNIDEPDFIKKLMQKNEDRKNAVEKRIDETKKEAVIQALP